MKPLWSFPTLDTTRIPSGRGRLCLVLALLAPALEAAGQPEPEPPAGMPGGPGLALIAAKALTAAENGEQVIDDALVLIEDGKIAAVGSRRALEIPEGYAQYDVGERWLMPGMVDLHSHVGGSRDINDAVYQANPGLRVYPAVIPSNPALERALAAGVTTILFIPGSATNIGGQGILMKTGAETYESSRIRAPGSLKIAQGDNPTRWGYGMRRALMAFHVRSDLRKGRAYAERWAAYEKSEGPEPERDIQLDVYRDLFGKLTQVSTHTQYYQLVLTTITMLKGEFGLDVYIDHGSFDSYLTGAMAEEMGVPAILGPREVLWPRPPRYDTDGKVIASAQGFQQQGHKTIGFNTDAPVVPQEELPLQAAMGVRYGMDNTQMEAVRGLTIVPAMVAGIANRVGSLEPGKDADILVIAGDPADPRSGVDRVYLEGGLVYDAEEEGRQW